MLSGYTCRLGRCSLIMLHTDGKSCVKLTEKEKQPDKGLVIKSVSGSECSEGKKNMNTL